MTQHNSFPFLDFPTITNCWKFTCTYIICIVIMYLFIICSSCSSFIAIRNLNVYTNIIATPIDVHDIVEIIYYAYIYVTVLNPLAFDRFTLVSIHSSSDRIDTAPNDPNMIHLLLGFHISEFVVIVCHSQLSHNE